MHVYKSLFQELNNKFQIAFRPWSHTTSPASLPPAPCAILKPWRRKVKACWWGSHDGLLRCWLSAWVPPPPTPDLRRKLSHLSFAATCDTHTFRHTHTHTQTHSDTHTHTHTHASTCTHTEWYISNDSCPRLITYRAAAAIRRFSVVLNFYEGVSADLCCTVVSLSN